jgi:hypothetical protein
LKKLQRNKVVGLDGMKAKFILDVGELLHMPLLTMFNYFLVEGFPKALSTGWSTRSLKGAMLQGDNSWAYPSKVVRYET